MWTNAVDFEIEIHNEKKGNIYRHKSDFKKSNIKT